MRDQLIIMIITITYGQENFDDVLSLSNEFLPGEDTSLGGDLVLIRLRNYECK